MEMISLPYKFGAWHADLALETSPEESQNDEAKASRKVGQAGRPVGPEEALRGAPWNRRSQRPRREAQGCVCKELKR